MHSILTPTAGNSERSYGKDLTCIRELHDILIRLQIPRPRIASLFYYWRPIEDSMYK